ncbi:MAG: class 3 fructose-bisphosphatase [Bacteroidetes bacterium]|nr:MAG: class 3 fructose-bisphosphatase [Bacteroidota bacterium]
MNLSETDLHYLELLSKNYPTIQKASTEIINLYSILNLPKGTEHYMSDIHGEYEAFTHILNNASGVIMRKINDIFKDSMRTKEKKALATLIFYPKRKLKIVLREEQNPKEWYRLTLLRLIEVCRSVSSKYTRSKVRKSLPKDFAYVIEELLHEKESAVNKQDYYNGIINSIISTERANAFIIAICTLIRNLSIDRLHIVGDIYDRGESPDKVMDELMAHNSLDIQWGNHDIVWMGAALGCKAYIATVLRIAARYDNLRTIEESYGINTLPLATFALEVYQNDPCEKFYPKLTGNYEYTKKQIDLISRIHKAISIIQFKLEAQIIKQNPQFEMNDRLLLDKIDYEKGTIELDGETYKLNDTNFPTIDPKNPYKLTKEENEVINRLKFSFLNSEKLQKHIKFLFDKGSMYLVYNSNLLYHGCIPLNKDGSFKKIKILDKKYYGKSLVDKLDQITRRCYFNKINNIPSSYEIDYMWYLWSGPDSPLFGKSKMATFERYFIDDKKTHVEVPNPYFDLRDDVKTVDKILKEFDLNPETSHIINGHIPVKYRKGENPVKANGKLIVIDGGLAKAYQPVTGIAGCTLIYNSYGLILVTHKPFVSTKEAIEKDKDIFSSQQILEQNTTRKKVGDTDIGKEIKKQIKELEMLLFAYREGLITEYYKLKK